MSAEIAAALLAAGATAAGPCPTDPAGAVAWERQVAARAFGLAALVPAVAERVARVAECRPVTGVIADAVESKGRGLITIHATMGTPKRNQAVVNGRGVEHIRTAWLSEPAGRALFDQAKSLVGHHCRFGKWVDQVSADLKVSMVEWIEDLGPDPAAPADARRPAGPSAAPSADDDPFRPFDESNMTLAGPVWARQFKVAMTASGHGPKVQEAVVHYATGGMTRAPESVRRTQTAVVASTHRRLDAGELVTSTDDSGRIVLVEASTARGAA